MTTTRDQIIQKTCELIELQGYHATGLSQILKESRSPKGSLYYYFPDGKESLVTAAVQHVGGIVLRRMQTILTEQEQAAEAIHALIVNIAYNVEHSGFRAGGPITTVAMEAAATSDSLRQACDAIYAEWIQLVTDRLITAGLNRERAARLADLTIAGVEGGIILSRTARSQRPLLSVAEEVRNLIRIATG